VRGKLYYSMTYRTSNHTF